MAFAVREKTIVNPAKFGHKAKARRSPGKQISWVLNPGSRSGRKGKMAKKKTTKKPWSSHHKAAGAKGNPAKKYYGAKKNGGYCPKKRNPAGFSFGQLIETGIFATVGAVGSKLLTQVVLGSSNTGIMGYLGNVVAGTAIGLAADKVLKNRQAAFAVYVGTAIQIVLRAISDFTPYGSYAALSGVGDYQVSNFVTPQRYVDALHGAMVQVPNGWGAPAPVAIASSGVPADHSAGMSGTSIYGSGGSIYEG